MSLTSLWTQYRDELASDPLLVLALTAALVALATTPLAFAVLGRLDWFKARRGRVMQRPEFSSIVVGMMLVMGIPAIFAALVLKSRYFDKNRYEFDPNKTWSVLEQGRGFKTCKEADEAVKLEMERLAAGAEEPGRQRQEAGRGDARAAGRGGDVAGRGAGGSRASCSRWPGCARASGVDGPQQLLDFTAPPVDLRGRRRRRPRRGRPRRRSPAGRPRPRPAHPRRRPATG